MCVCVGVRKCVCVCMYECVYECACVINFNETYFCGRCTVLCSELRVRPFQDRSTFSAMRQVIVGKGQTR